MQAWGTAPLQLMLMFLRPFCVSMQEKHVILKKLVNGHARRALAKEEIPSTLEHQRMAVHLFVQAELMVQIVGLVVLIYPRPPDKVYKSYGMTLHP